jgi:lipase maturation factor 1
MAEAAPSLRGVRRCLLAGVGVTYVAAFASMAVQLRGLVGEGGILPNADWFRYAAERASFADAPSLCWGGGCSDFWLLALAWGGALAGALLAAGVLPLACAAFCWLAYLSLGEAGQLFFSYQWDALLLEAGFLALFLAPPDALTPRSVAWGREPPRAAIWLFRWLLFRLVWSSGWVKLTSGDPTWRDLTALSFHYVTQPLPTCTSWWMHQLPLPVQKLSTLMVLACELGVPLGYFAPRRIRFAAAGITGGLMLLISATGNYGFFNLLTAVLCLSLLDDAALPARLRGAAEALPAWRTHARIATAAGAALAGLGLSAMLLSIGPPAPLRDPILTVFRLQAGFRLANPYGLFAVMTTERPELAIEGSDDGEAWRPYAFRWKPGDPQRAPRFAGLHLPRLDWQLWFAALERPEQVGWLRGPFLSRLLAASPQVLALLADDPFRGAPPRFVRVRVDDYRFTSRAQRAATGAWWDAVPVRIAIVRSSAD